MFFFSFQNQNKILDDTKHFNSEKKEREERRKMKREKEIDKDSYWHITYITYTKLYHMLSICICKLFHTYDILSSSQLVHWTLTQLLYSRMKNFTNNILRLLGVKHRKIYSVNLC